MGHIIAMDPALEFYFVRADFFFSLRRSSAYDVFFLTRHEMFVMRLPNHIAVYVMTEIN